MRKKFRDANLCLKCDTLLAGSCSLADHKTALKLIFVQPLRLDDYIFSWKRYIYRLLVDEDAHAVSGASRRHDGQLLAFEKSSSLDLSKRTDGPHILVAVNDRDPKASLRVPLGISHVVQDIDQAVTIVPRAHRLVHFLQQVSPGVSRHRKIHNVLFFEVFFQEGIQFLYNAIVAFLRPFYSGFVHLVDCNYETRNSEGFRKHSMLTSLSPSVKSSFELRLTR
mmetsp:Transcript_38621/g.74944  ORF Transcript_38621/g.74944 Transcript_38621/m.74944 type:complete len:223 (-) Transcript_38621:891-1559(-)